MITDGSLVLVVDDEPNMRDILRRILEKEGYQVITAPDGETALRLIKKNKPDLVLLDLMMPGISGRDVCRNARKFSPSTRVIYLTAMVELVNQSRASEIHSEADAFITKPASGKRILSMVASILNSV